MTKVFIVSEGTITELSARSRAAAVTTGVGDGVGLEVADAVGEAVAEGVAVAVAVRVGVGVEVGVDVEGDVTLGVAVLVRVGVSVGVSVGVKVAPPMHTPVPAAQNSPGPHSGDTQHTPLTQFVDAHSSPSEQSCPFGFGCGHSPREKATACTSSSIDTAPLESPSRFAQAGSAVRPSAMLTPVISSPTLTTRLRSQSPGQSCAPAGKAFAATARTASVAAPWRRRLNDRPQGVRSRFIR
jgi:hypothetical protein